MKGIKLRGFNHLANLLDKVNDTLRIISISGDSHLYESYAFKAEAEVAHKTKDPRAILFLSRHGNSINIDRNRSVLKSIELSHNIKIDEKYADLIEDLYFNRNFRVYIATPRKPNGRIHGDLPTATGFNYNIVLNSENIKEYEDFTTVNKKVYNTVIQKYIRDTATNLFIFALTEGNPVYFSWAAKMIAMGKLNFHSLVHLMEFANECNNSIKKLSKQNIVSLSSSKDILNGVWELFHIRAEIVANKTLNLFNPKQKHLLKEKVTEPSVIQILNNFSKLSTIKKINFVRKVSTIENVDEILNLMQFVCTNSYFNWNQEDFHKFIENVEGLDYTVVAKKPNLTVIKVHDFETVKRLGKMTNWCISKNRSYWDQYINRSNHVLLGGFPTPLSPNNAHEEIFELTDDDKSSLIRKLIESDDDYRRNKKSNIGQYMIFDFNRKEDDKLSIVGLTANTETGITHAHNFINEDMTLRHEHPEGMMPNVPDVPNGEDSEWMNIYNTEEEDITVEESKPKADERSIFGFLDNRNIDASLFTQYEYKRFVWNKKNLLAFIDKHLDDGSYDIIYDDNDKLLIRTNSLRIGFLLDHYSSIFRIQGTSTYRNEGIKAFFCYFDFTNPKFEPSSMLVYPIFEENLIEKAVEPFNQLGNQLRTHEKGYREFTDLILSLGLPFDLIRRPDTLNERFKHYLLTDNSKKVFELLSKDSSLLNNIDHNIQKFFVNSLLSNIYNPKELNKNYDFITGLNVPFSKIFYKKGILKIINNYISLVIKEIFRDAPAYDTLKIIDNKEEAFDFLKKAIAENEKNPYSRKQKLYVDTVMNLYMCIDIVNKFTQDGDLLHVYSQMLNKMIAKILEASYVTGRGKEARTKDFIVNFLNRYEPKRTTITSQAFINLFKLYNLHPELSNIVDRNIEILFKNQMSPNELISILSYVRKQDNSVDYFDKILKAGRNKGIILNQKDLQRLGVASESNSGGEIIFEEIL